MGQFQSKLVKIEAEQFTRDGPTPPGLCGGPSLAQCGVMAGPHAHGKQGPVKVDLGDWLIAEMDGSGHYPCKPDVFERRWESVKGNERPPRPELPLDALSPIDRELASLGVAPGQVEEMHAAIMQAKDEPPATRQTFGWAIRQMQDGACVQRAGWNGKGMHLYLEDGFAQTITAGAFAGSTRTYEPCIVMFTAQGKHQPGWLASQADMLAADWSIAEPK